MEIQYDTISDSKYHWKLSNWKVRKLQGMKEHITERSTEGHPDYDGAYRPGLFQGSAGNLHQS